VADQARDKSGLGKAVTFNVITPMKPWTTWIVKLTLWYFDLFKSTQITAQQLSFLPFVHWVVVKRNALLAPEENSQKERFTISGRRHINYDYLFFLSTFNGSWGPYIDAFADVLFGALDAVWFWSIGYPGARPVTALKNYIVRNQIESDHHYSAYPQASVRDVRSALHLKAELQRFSNEVEGRTDEQFASAYNRLLFAVQNDLARIHTLNTEENRQRVI
jgi:hypothetical protein